MLDEEHDRLVCYLIDHYGPYFCEDAWEVRTRWTLCEESEALSTSFGVLKDAHRALKLKGPFEPVESGPCVALAIEDGAWAVRPAKVNRWYVLNREPDTPDSGLLRALRPLGPVTAAEALRKSSESPILAAVLDGMSSHQLGLRLRSIKRQGPTHGMALHSKRCQSDTQVWHVVRMYGGDPEHPDAPLLRAWKNLGKTTAADALRRLEPTGLIRESTAQALGARLRGIKNRPINDMVLRGKWKQWWLEDHS